MATATSCQFDSNKSDSAISTSFSNDEFTNCSSSEESSSNSSNESEESNVSSSSQAEVECSSSTLNNPKSPLPTTPTLCGNGEEKIEETLSSSLHSSTHSVGCESEVSSTTSGSVSPVRTSSLSSTNNSNSNDGEINNSNSSKSSNWLYNSSDFSVGRVCIFQEPFLNTSSQQHLNQQQQQQQPLYFYTTYQNNNNNANSNQHCYCYTFNNSHQNATHQQPLYYYTNQSHHHSQHQQQSFYCYQPYHHNHHHHHHQPQPQPQHHHQQQQQLFYHYAYQQHQPVVFLSPTPPLPAHHLQPHVPQPLGQFATIVPYATTTQPTIPATITAPIVRPAASNQPHSATLIQPPLAALTGHQTHLVASTAHPQLHLGFNPIAPSTFAIPPPPPTSLLQSPLSSATAVASGPVSGSPVIAFSQLKLGYNLISLLPIDAQPARVRQAYGMDKVWHDEFEQLFSQFISSIVWALIEVETMPKIRGSDSNSNNESYNVSSDIKGNSSSNDSRVAQIDDSTSGISINEESNGSNDGCSSCCSSENDSNDLIDHRAVDNNQGQSDETTGLNSSPGFNPKPTRSVPSVNQNHENVHDSNFSSNQNRYPTRFRVFIDSAKVRFCCDNCGHGWTSMKGRVVFWYELFEATSNNNNNQPSMFNVGGGPNNVCNETTGIFNNASNYLIGYVAYKLFGQQCDICKIENRFERPMWYPEEVTKVLNNLYNKIGQIYFGFEMPGIDKQRRAGKPKTSHNSSLCQACHDGVCTDRK